MDKRDMLAGMIVGGLASAGVLGSGRFLYGWDVGDVPAYELSHALGNLFGFWSLLVGAGVLLLLVRFSWASYLISAGIVPLPMVSAILYECVMDPTSHNLIPFELIVLAIGSGLLHLPSLAVKAIYEWLSTRSSGGPSRSSAQVTENST